MKRGEDVYSAALMVSVSGYGVIESLLMSSYCSPFIVMFLSALVLSPIIFSAFLIEKHFPRGKTFLAFFLMVFLILYAVSVVVLIKYEKLVVFRFPNLLPRLFSVGCSRGIPVDVYHLVFFGFGFLSLLLAYSIPSLLSYGTLAFFSTLFSLSGSLLIGLVYEDWIWFISYPGSCLRKGGQYGIFFESWSTFMGFSIPTMYVLGITIGSLLIIFSSIIIKERKILIPLITEAIIGLICILVSASICSV